MKQIHRNVGPVRSRYVRVVHSIHYQRDVRCRIPIHQFGGETWKLESSHRLVDWLDYAEPLESKVLVLNGIVCSAISGESPAAIDRVRERDDFVKLLEAFQTQE